MKPLIENHPPFKASWNFRLGAWLLDHDIPLAAALLVLVWIIFLLSAPLFWKACS